LNNLHLVRHGHTPEAGFVFVLLAIVVFIGKHKSRHGLGMERMGKRDEEQE
jgi:hypothetical protein